ncbi:hypothetical protein BDZ85DRAFT_260670 [Elsinoe ampelina]|uniref:C2H2-type domain-containing protein n=1 Tax=Elsinoe ampelina TaxID=302913 RepID=A0A6A6GF77_9PEZI|nr:hypothetical protein BDZ85DRAFT_260670 [Elsinoe ampelina]
MAAEEVQAQTAPASTTTTNNTTETSLQLPAQPARDPAAETLTCQWLGCGERCPNAEQLYEHVCERHVGRKSTNNLNLTCQWGACRTTTVKRDHITSHMRVHVPLKPHKCEFCGKSFKRPQDLKKHVKTHADDSVLLRSPESNMNNNQNAYYPGHDINGSYPPPPGQHVGGNNFNSYPNPPAYSGYGQVNYPGTSLADQQSMDTRRRAIEALNDFLGDVKRRALDPHNYYDVGSRLNTQSLPLPVSIGAGYSIGSGYNGAGNGNGHGNNFNSVSSMLESFNGSSGVSMNNGSSAVAQGALAQNYQLPLSNARTKGDLLDIDRFLEQLSATVYESSGQSAAAGVQQPGVHTQLPGYNLGGGYHRSSHSPPQTQHSGSVSSAGGMQPLSSVAQMASMTASAQGMDTPALTPASVSSYASSGHSPMSSHSRSSGDGASMYPQLPSVTSMSDMGSGYSSAPASGLASGFDGYDSRRYSGGRLQREAPARRGSDAMDIDSEGQRTPRKMSVTEKRPTSSSNVDPALRSTPPGESAVSSPQSDSADDKAQEAWVENVRVIEQLRNWIRDRLSSGDFDKSEDSTPEPAADHQMSKEDSKEEEDVAPIAYPTLKLEA